MPKRRSLATLEDMKVGQVIYLIGYDSSWSNQIVLRTKITKVELDLSISRYPFFEMKGKRHHRRSAADAGVIGCQYDDRPCQVFLNARSANHWLKKWKGKNPNFINRHTGRYYRSHL